MSVLSERFRLCTTWVLVLIFCLGLLSTSAQAFTETDGQRRAPTTDEFEAAREFTRHALAIGALLDEIARADEGDPATAIAWDAVFAERERLAALDAAVREQFEQREQELVTAGLPDVALERHRETVRGHAAGFQVLNQSLAQMAALRQQGKTDELRELLQATRDHVQLYQAPATLARPLPDDPPIQVVRKEAPVQDLSAPGSKLSVRAAAVPSGPPVAADLDPTIDIQFTPELDDLALSLGNSPLRIYEHVAASFDSEPYLGSRKGSQETLLVGSGNDYDLASLLIGLLRVSDIPARYVTGEVFMPIDQAMNWLGVEDPMTAGNLLATVGVDVTLWSSGDGIVAASFDHVWVAAYVPYANYRGIPNDTTGAMWIPLDPSLKSYDYSEAVDIPAEMGFDADSFIDDYIHSWHDPSPVERYLQQIEDYIVTSRPDLTYPEDAFRVRAAIPDELGALPGSPPFIVLSQDADYAEIPAAMRHQMRFHIRNDSGATLIDYTANVPQIAGKRVTISYVAATQADQDTIDVYGDLYSTPPDLIALKPVLKIDGLAVAEGGSIAAGINHYSDMHFYPPTGESNPVPSVYNYIISGVYQAIGIDTFKVGMGIFIPTEDGAGPATDGLTGEKLYRTAMGYLNRVDQADEQVAQTMQMVYTTSLSEAIVENVLAVWTSAGVPVDWEWRGLIVDADRKIMGPFSITGTAGEDKAFMVLAGADGSISENRIFEDLYSERAVSTIKILELAADQAIPIYEIDSGNKGTILPLLTVPQYIKDAVENSVDGGRVVTIARDEIDYGQWHGTGWIDMDPSTGAAGYIIAGGHSGGATVDVWTSGWSLTFATLFQDVCSILANITYPSANEYFPYPSGIWGRLFSRQPPRFEVDYTVNYCGGGSRVVHEMYAPHFQYPPGDYVFYAGWGTGATLPFTIFGVEVETPDDVYAPKDGDSVTLNAKVTPRAPPGATFQWTKHSSGDGTFSNPTAQSPEFTGTAAGDVTAKVEVTNANGSTDADKKLTIFAAEIKESSDGYMAKGYTGAPVAGDPDAANIDYRIDPGGFLGIGGFTPKEVKLVISQGATDIRTAILDNSSGDKDWDWDGKDDAGDYVDADVYQVKLEVTAPNDRKLESDPRDVTVVEVTQVEILKSGGGALEANSHPTQAGGLRVFPGKATAAGAVNDEVLIRVTLSTNVPAGELNVYLESFDVNDPTGLINDNHDGGLLGTPKEGDLSDEDPPTDGDNKVEVDFTVTMQPGDNFKVFASTNEKLIDNLTDAIVEANTNNAGATTNARLQPLASDRLTVWRRVHVEMDSMGAVAGNVINGTITSVVNNGDGTSTVTTNQNISETPNAVNRFEGGRLSDSANAFTVASNTDGNSFTVRVNNVGATVPISGSAFTLVDDDDYNADDGANLDGDAAEDVGMPNTTMVQASDIAASNVYAPAFVRPIYDVGDNNTNVAFLLNTPDGADETALLLATYDFDTVGSEADDDFWTIYLLGAYQMQTEEDCDPDPPGACTLGQVDDINGQGANSFREATHEGGPFGGACGEAAVVAHEIGHLFNGIHADVGLMNSPCNAGTLSFSNDTLRRIRNIDHP